MKKFNNLRIETLEEKLKSSNPPFDPDPPKKNPSAVAGKYGQGYSTAKHLAKRGMAQGAKKVAEENLDEISTKTLAKAAKSASDPDSDYYYGKSHDPQKFADHAKKTKDAKSAAAVQGAADAKSHYARPGHTLGSYDKLAHRTPARVTSTGKANKQDVKTLKGNIQRNEEVTTTHEDPLVVVKDAEGNILTHANRSVAGDIHGINVSHHAIHTGMPVEVVDRDGKKLTVQKSMHHDSEVAKDNAPAVKEETDKEETDTPKKFTHVLIHSKTGNVVGKYTSLKAASRAGDRKDLAYGAVAHHVNYIGEANEEVEIVYEANIEPTSAKSRSHIGNLSNPTVNSVVHSGKEIGLITKQPNGKYHAHHSAAKLAHAQGGTFDTKDKAHQFVRDAHAKAIQNGTLKSNRMSEAKEKTEYDYEGDMARGQLQSIIMNAQRVHDMLKDNDNLPEWVQSKITLAEDYISTVSNYMSSEIDEMHLSFGSQNKKPAPVSTKLADMKKYFATNDKDQMKQKITGKKFRDMSEYETWMKSKGAMQVASFEPDGENTLDELSKNTLQNYKVAGHKKFDSIRNNTDADSMAKKAKLEKGIKTASAKQYPKPVSTPAPKADPNSRGYEKGRYMGDSVEQDSESQIDELKSSTYQSYVDKVADPKVASKRGNTQKGVPKSIKAIGGVTKAIGKQNFAARLASAASRNF